MRVFGSGGDGHVFYGCIVGTKIENVNQYIVGTLPFEILGFVPVIFYRAGVLWDDLRMLIHPGCAVIRLIEGDKTMMLLSLVSVMVWIVVFNQYPKVMNRQ